MTFKDFLGMATQEKKRKERAKAAKQVAIGVGVATLAAAAGVAAGILLAPKSGKETWNDILHSCKNGIAHQGCCHGKGEDGDAAGAPDDIKKE